MTRLLLLLVLALFVYETRAALQTYAMKYRICDSGELPKFGEQGQWSCYTTCNPSDLYRSQPCVQQLPLTMLCPGVYRLRVYATADAQGFYLTGVEQCVYPVYATCAGSQQITLCNVTSPGCLFYDTFDPARFYTGSCAQPYGIPTGGNVFRPCTPAELTQACYADEQRCTYDDTLDHFLFECPWTAELNGGVWDSNNTVPGGIELLSQCSDIESETRCAADWRTRVPREPCSRRIVRFHEYKGHDYAYDMKACNRKPCSAAQQLSVCGTYTSDCWNNCPTPTDAGCTLEPNGCSANLTSPEPARYCTENERVQTGCVTLAAVRDECRVRCNSTDLLSGCVLESRCLWSQGFPRHQWNSLHLLPNVSYVCSPDEHTSWCGDRSVLDPFRQDPSSLCRKLCNAAGVCALRDAASCNRVPCNYTTQTLACASAPLGTNNSRCSVLAQCSDFAHAGTCTTDAYCPTGGYATPPLSNNISYAQAYWDSWFSSDAVIPCNATEFGVSCAPFGTMCRRRCPGWNATRRAVYDAATPSAQALFDVSDCVLEQKCTLGDIPWTSFNRDGSTGSTRVRACTTPEWQTTCATTLAGCRVACDLDGISNCNITAACPWSFGFIPHPAVDPDPQTCSVNESLSICGVDYTSPCYKYNCTYLGFSDTHVNCTVDVSSCNSRECTPAEQQTLCGYYTHGCRVKCNAAGICSLFGTCGAAAPYPARECNDTELLDSCAAFDSDCRVICLDANLTWGCTVQNICPWTAGQWINDQIEPVPYSRGLDFATASFCGPGWQTDAYSNNCELFECINTRRLGRHDCTCHYATCYCPFRYDDGVHKCSTDEAQIRACDGSTGDAETDANNVRGVARYCGRFGRTCALYCTGDKAAPACDVISPCTCLDDFSFAPLHGLPCQGYAQYCNVTEWATGCGLYAATCVWATPNATSLRTTQVEDGAATCTCLSGIVPETTSGALPCRTTPAANDGSILRACTLSEAQSACGAYADACQYHIPTARAVASTCHCNASSVEVAADATYTSRLLAPSYTCPGPWVVRNCTAGELARCEETPPGGGCQVNVSLAAPAGRLVNRSLCFPDHYNYSCECPEDLARARCGIGYVSCTVLGTYNQVDGCYDELNDTAVCTCDPFYNDSATALGYTCANASSVVRNCTGAEILRYCGNTVDSTALCFMFALNNSFVNGSCAVFPLLIRDCDDAERAFMCPLQTNRSEGGFCRVITTTYYQTVYQTVNASCPWPTQIPAYLALPLLPANSTGFPRECTTEEISRECAHDVVCDEIAAVPGPACNLTGNLTDGPILNYTEYAALNFVNISFNETLLAEQNRTIEEVLQDLYDIYLETQYDLRNATACSADVSNGTVAPVCRIVNNRTAGCYAAGPADFRCTCAYGFGPLNARYSFSGSGFITSDPRDAHLGQCEGVVRPCDAGEETVLYGGRFATSCQLSCSAQDRTQNCIIYSATCDRLNPNLPSLGRNYPVQLTANELSAFFPLTVAQPCDAFGAVHDQLVVAANATNLTVGEIDIDVSTELRRRCGPYVESASFLVFDCNVTHSLCEPEVRYALYMFQCQCQTNAYPGPSGLLPCETHYYTRACNASEDALVPRGAFDPTCHDSYRCRLLCYPANATQPELCFRHAPDPCLDTFGVQRWGYSAAAQAVCGTRSTACYGSCRVNSDLAFSVECDPNALVRCVCDTFNTTFFTGVSGLPCDRDYVVQRLTTRDNLTQWCGILAEAGTVRCRDVNDSSTCYQADACVCQFDAGDGATPLAYVGYQVNADGNATLVNNATLNTTITRRPVFAHCAYVYSVGTAINSTRNDTDTVVTGQSLYKHKRLPIFRRKAQNIETSADGLALEAANATTVVLVNNGPVLIGVSLTTLGFSCDYQQKCGTFTEATITACSTVTRTCNVTCGCYRGTTTMVGTNVPCSAFIQSCDDAQRARCAVLKNVSRVSACQATCDETNTRCEPIVGTCVVDNSVVVPRYLACSDVEATRYCGREFTANSCQRKAVCTSDPPQPDCFKCDCAQLNGYILDPSRLYGHWCTNLMDEFTNCTAIERGACGLRGIKGCRKRLIYGGHYATLLGRQQFDDRTWALRMADWKAGRMATNLLSGLLGGIWIQECTCLFDLFNTLDLRRSTTSQLNDTWQTNASSVTGGTFRTDLRCDAGLTSYLIQRGACPFRADTGMPCNNAGVCEGPPGCTLATCANDNATWPAGVPAEGSFLTHEQRRQLALNSGIVWLYSDPSGYENCRDGYCGGSPITGRVARQAYPNNAYMASVAAGSDTTSALDELGVPVKCISTNARSTLGTDNDGVTEGTTLADATAWVKTRQNLDAKGYAAAPPASTNVVWDNCMLRVRGPRQETCYELSSRTDVFYQGADLYYRYTKQSNSFLPAGRYFGRANMLLSTFTERDQSYRQWCYPFRGNTIQYVHVCAARPTFDPTVLQAYGNWLTCYYTPNVADTHGGTHCYGVTTCQPGDLLGLLATKLPWSLGTTRATASSIATRWGLTYRTGFNADGTMWVSADTPSYECYRPSKIQWTLPLLRDTINPLFDAADPNKWMSGCLSSRTTLTRNYFTDPTTTPINPITPSQTNWCTAWQLTPYLEFTTGNDNDFFNMRTTVGLTPRRFDALYCYVAKPTDSVYLWYGINNEVFYPRVNPTANVGATIGPAFASVFANLPNRCTRCATFPGTQDQSYTGPNCDIQVVDSAFYMGYVGLCEARGTCCGRDQQCVVPADWDGRTGCINGVFDFDQHRCVCDGNGWRTTGPAIGDPGSAGYCNFNACARDINTGVFFRGIAGDSLNPICNGRGDCLNDAGLCRCTNLDYGGRLCQLNRFTHCPGGDLINRIECNGHGTCIMDSYLNTATCQCHNETGAGGYWSGSACNVPHTPDDATCTVHGGVVRVHPTRGVPYCACPTLNGVPLKGGQYCEYSRCPVANGKVCNGQGICTVNGTNPAGFPAFSCRQPLPISTVCSVTDVQCAATTAVPPVCNANLDYNGCACEQPIRVLCAPAPSAPLCSVTGSPIDQLDACQVQTNLADGTVAASCLCGPAVEGAFCQDSVCGDCGTGGCDPATRSCVCRTVDLALNGLWLGASCNVSVTTSCGYSLVSGGDLYMCSGHGSCVELPGGGYGCACDPGYTGAKCELSDCPAPCDDRSDCSLPPNGGVQKECICRYPLVYSRNTTHPNLCNIDQCTARNIRTRANAAGDGCECLEASLSLASGCTQTLCPADTDTGQMCGPANAGSCPEGECITNDCKISYDYSVVGGAWVLAGDSRRRLLCDRYQKKCLDGTCECGLGYTQDAVTGLCVRVCHPDNTVAIVPCINTLDPLCIDARFNPSLSGRDYAFTCKCQPAYTGSRYCDTLLCAHGGTLDPTTNSTCVCPFPWTGSTCTDNLCVHGTANLFTSRCDCLFGWAGARCDQNPCQNGGTPDATKVGGCRCPAKWGGANCSSLLCNTNNFWDETLQTCVCQPGFQGAVCDQLKCGNNKNVDATGACVCAPAGQINQYIDPLCNYRWCGAAGSRVCIGSMCICICNDRLGSYLDPVTGNCTIPICGAHASFSAATAACVCDAGYEFDTAVPLRPCVRDCGPYGTYNSITGTCVCAADYFGTNCEFSTVAFLQPLLPAAALAAATLPSGATVEASADAAELQIATPAPAAIINVVLVDPLPWAISYQEDAERAIRQSIQGYETLYVDLVDHVREQGGLALTTDPASITLANVSVTVADVDNALAAGIYYTQIALQSVTAVLGTLTVALVTVAVRFNFVAA